MSNGRDADGDRGIRKEEATETEGGNETPGARLIGSDRRFDSFVCVTNSEDLRHLIFFLWCNQKEHAPFYDGEFMCLISKNQEVEKKPVAMKQRALRNYTSLDFLRTLKLNIS